MAKKGIKYDGEKPRWDLLDLRVIQETVRILTFGAKKYDDDNWQHVLLEENGSERYYAAAMRHLADWQHSMRYGDKKSAKDEESGLSHLSHAMCCLYFLKWKEMHDEGKIGIRE